MPSPSTATEPVSGDGKCWESNSWISCPVATSPAEPWGVPEGDEWLIRHRFVSTDWAAAGSTMVP